MATPLDEQSINTIRMLSADAVEKAKSGHPGLPMGAAAFAYALWTRHLRFNPKNPDWPNRDRFVLSAGHGSMLLYSLLHLTGYDLPLSELERFRQWGSLCPGHPEHGLTPGVETTTGPLGQGFATGVGMALAERLLADRYNKDGFALFDHQVYALVSDGDLMEGVTAEAASFAGGLSLGNLVYLYDSNRISIEGSTDLAFCEDVGKRFEAYGWHVLRVADGNDIEAVSIALTEAKKDPRPSLIILSTHIGFGSPDKQDTASAHGAPLGEEELAKTKKNLGWPAEPPFFIPEDVRAHMLEAVPRGAVLEKEWNELFAAYAKQYPDLAHELESRLRGELPDLSGAFPDLSAPEKPLATREASGKVMQSVAKALPLFAGGSADLAPSNDTRLKEFGDVTCGAWEPGARNFHYGVREHAMGAVTNGLALSKAVVPFCATFLIFSDYMRGAIRLAALMKLRVVYVFTHDSIGQGEDGATHQPIEHLASLRAMPGLTVIRPADAAETVEAWKRALASSGPTALVLTRQKVPTLPRASLASAENLRRGGYVIKDAARTPDIVLIATGSEVAPTLAAAVALEQDGIAARVVSLPSTGLFDAESEAYRRSVLPEDVPRLSVEAAASFGWEKYVGPSGDIVGIDSFGASAPGSVMLEKFGFTAENIEKRARALLSRNK